MSTQQRLAGVTFVSIDGVSYPTVGDVEWTPSDVTRESLVGIDRYHGYKEIPAAVHMSCTLRDTQNTQVGGFRDMVNVTVLFQVANGKSIIGTNMVTTEAIVVNAVEGTLRVRWEGAEVIEA